MNKIIILCTFFLLGILTSLSAQTRIKMQEEGGVYTIPCEVNGLRLRFILDTGANRVSISQTEANFMLKNGYLDQTDFTKGTKTSIVNGRIVANSKVNLLEIKIGNKVLKNIEAVVVPNLKAPVLLGHSAMQQLGSFMFDGDELVIETANKKTSNTPPSSSRSGNNAGRTKINNLKTYKVADLSLDIPNPSEWKINVDDSNGFILFTCISKINSSGLTIISLEGENSSEDIANRFVDLLASQMGEMERGKTRDGIFGGSQVPFWTNSKSKDDISGFIDSFTRDGQVYIVMTGYDQTSSVDDLNYIYKSMRLR